MYIIPGHVFSHYATQYCEKKKNPAICHLNFHPKTSTDETNIRQASESTNTYLFSEVIAEDTGYKDRDWQSPRDGIVCCFGKRRVDVQIKGQNANSKAEQKSDYDKVQR